MNSVGLPQKAAKLQKNEEDGMCVYRYVCGKGWRIGNGGKKENIHYRGKAPARGFKKPIKPTTVLHDGDILCVRLSVTVLKQQG